MPKRKAAAALSNSAGDEDPIQANDSGRERPTKKQRGRPRSKSAEMKPLTQAGRDSSTALPQASEAPTRKSGRRGRPKGSRNSVQATQDISEEQAEVRESEHETGDQEAEGTAASNDEADDAQEVAKPARTTKSTRAAPRGRKNAATRNSVQTDGGFEYTPSTGRQRKSLDKPEDRPEPPKRQKRKPEVEENNDAQDNESTAPDVVDETLLQDAPIEARSVSRSPTKRQSQRGIYSSPSKSRLGGTAEANVEPELRRRIGELTKKCDTLENRYRNLKEIGIVEANSNMEKLRKQCESMTNASNNLIASLKAELEAQKALGQQSRSLQRQLKERDAEVAQLKSQAEEATSQLSSAQTEVKALQTKLAAARNTAASLENAAIKMPGSAIKSGANRANAAAVTAEAAQAAQFAQLKEDLYTDLTGLIIRDVKKRPSDNLYDCIQTGSNGTLHFKLVVPHVSSANFESAEFQYIPLLDENRDRELVDVLPEYLTVDITFVRQQASKFYTRVIDALTKRRSTAAI
ncbi:putative chromosome segregation protein (Pcs1) [Aspergillus luchuensis]|uniref:Chromosome segregation protein n=1 Tax=Aspergillus kawachii TaxID=1069201 RepID=A0A146FGH5_ASPKA|nr:uncharacterized protein AKAW2_40779S [Aspergillus luchuensis]BCR99096.1 hypothetical protein AKAW2_40779S [Aspergillus luchuensis]BCS11405.1 hypothetical protein ALUC_40745S [Aspergillus luchuensis]GAA87187.1 chromosome segregation protein [Aspergillus luchuensis IFO 4308]GAT25324.1 chromosome segregation protein [Aspergillus luchuensis]